MLSNLRIHTRVCTVHCLLCSAVQGVHSQQTASSKSITLLKTFSSSLPPIAQLCFSRLIRTPGRFVRSWNPFTCYFVLPLSSFESLLILNSILGLVNMHEKQQWLLMKIRPSINGVLSQFLKCTIQFLTAVSQNEDTDSCFTDEQIDCLQRLVLKHSFPNRENSRGNYNISCFL